MVRRVKRRERWIRPDQVRSSGTILRLIDADFEAVALEFGPVSDVELVARMRAVAAYMLDRFMAGRIKPGPNQSDADVLAILMTAAARAVDQSRAVAGKTYGQASTGLEVERDRTMTVERTVVTQKQVAVDEDGRAVVTSTDATSER